MRVITFARMGRPRSDEHERFWSKVDKTDSCWIWAGGRSPDGYGKFWIDGRTVRAHRYSYEQAHGTIVDGLVVCHRCDNPLCVNPAHLFVGTVADNQTDMVSKGRQSRGEAHGSAVLTDATVRSILIDWASGPSVSALARKYGVSRPTIKKVVTRQRWRHVGG